jgi:hypothetical protein
VHPFLFGGFLVDSCIVLRAYGDNAAYVFFQQSALGTPARTDIISDHAGRGSERMRERERERCRGLASSLAWNLSSMGGICLACCLDLGAGNIVGYGVRRVAGTSGGGGHGGNGDGCGSLSLSLSHVGKTESYFIFADS